MTPFPSPCIRGTGPEPRPFRSLDIWCSGLPASIQTEGGSDPSLCRLHIPALHQQTRSRRIWDTRLYWHLCIGCTAPAKTGYEPQPGKSGQNTKRQRHPGPPGSEAMNWRWIVFGHSSRGGHSFFSWLWATHNSTGFVGGARNRPLFCFSPLDGFNPTIAPDFQPTLFRCPNIYPLSGRVLGNR